MADAKKCDRCKKYYDNDNHMKKDFLRDQKDTYGGANNLNLSIVVVGYDMCENCVRSVLCSSYNLRLWED
jgi:hypothetical protein